MRRTHILGFGEPGGVQGNQRSRRVSLGRCERIEEDEPVEKPYRTIMRLYDMEGSKNPRLLRPRENAGEKQSLIMR